MALDGKFQITYGSRVIGGSSDTYQLDGPYALDKSFESLRLVFNVAVVGSSYTTLQSLSEALEDDFRKRDQLLKISIDGSLWTYTSGVDLLNVTASITKTGDSQTDRGFSRAYTCVVEGELPADDGVPSETGLRDLSFAVDYEPSRQKIITMQGVYTATTAEPLATENYLASGGADAEASTFLSTFAGDTFELVDEQYGRDRNDHTCQFSRQYVELLANQSQASLDDTEIRDHRMTFTETMQQPGDAQESIHRLRRVIATYDCAVDIEETTDVQNVFESKVEPHIRALFEANFTPQVFTIDDRRMSYDETSKRMSVSLQFLYQKDGGSEIIEVAEAIAYREQRTLDATPMYDKSETAAEMHIGWATIQRISTRTVTVIGEETPKLRLNKTPTVGLAGPVLVAGGGVILPFVQKKGWNLISNTSQVSKQWLGDPDVDQLELSSLTETIVEQWNDLPGTGTGSGGGPGGGA